MYCNALYIRKFRGRTSVAVLSKPVAGVWLYFRGVLSAVSYAFSRNSVQCQYKDDGKIVAEKQRRMKEVMCLPV